MEDGGQGAEHSWLNLLDPAKVLEDNGDLYGWFLEVLDTTGKFEGEVHRGRIERVEFAEMKEKKQFRIAVSVSLGRAMVPAGLIAKKGCPVIATVARQYEFIFDGSKVLPTSKNPPMHGIDAVATKTSYSFAK